ncbi:exonuclease SbcCD subunit D [Parahaliea sp. F7430]|uniref:Nuclease SbcCD subunit D n=1 Tax=Sediminihaliea albiluteola TaxID=2758564 RepID=A0A7W2YI78_9GAMM|nr:exonuclease SbcCD subunit D [Sediminihaliea albiluteola]MBA6412221.1 exonuclease SbcCD subunit D [Sediminihaliea albiluteola]
MRLLHTSDWHLGRQLHGVSLLEDQAHVLQQIVEIVREEAVDVVAIAGDIYDRSVPPAEAVSLMGEFLRSLCLELQRQVLVIAGNHDSPERLGFAAELFSDAGLHIAGPLQSDIKPITLRFAEHDYDFFALPYAGPATVRQALGAQVSTHEEAMAALLERAQAQRTAGRPSIVLAHCFVDGASESESERPLSMGGADRVPASLFMPYTYAALGHLHGRQFQGAPHIRYSGSILKYSFSEVNHNKSVTLVDISASGEIEIDERPLKPLRNLRILEGQLEELLEQGASDPHFEDFIGVRLSDSGALLDVMGKLRRVYPNALQAQFAAREQLDHSAPLASREMLQKSQLELFSEFFQEVQGDALSDEQKDYLLSVLDSLDQEEGNP